MAQLWLTDQELGEELGCEAPAAREFAISNHWVRKKSRDGFSRTLLPHAMMIAFFAKATKRLSETGLTVDQMVAMLRTIPDKPESALPISKAAS